MVWKIELSEAADRELDKLDGQVRRRILKFLAQQIATLDDPRALGEPLKGSELGGLWRYPVGDYRILCDIQDGRVLVLVLHVGHRREVYR